MQERDEELFHIYLEINDMEKHILQITIALIIAIVMAVISIATLILFLFILRRR